MATGDPMEVGIAVPFTNWRTERDYNADGLPDGWGKAGSAQTTWRRLQGNPTEAIRQFGLSTLGALGIYSASSSDYVWCRSRPNSVPQSGDTINGSLWFWYSPWNVTTDRLRAAVHILNAAGSSEGSTTGDSQGTHERGKWQEFSGVMPVFLTTTSMIEVRFYDAVTGGNPCRMMIDAPIVVWDARGLAGGFHTMESTPSVESALVPSSLGESERDANGGHYLADPYAATAKWTLRLVWDYMSVADYQYWLSAYAVNRGASGFKSASGARLEPMPVVVAHHWFEPIDYSDALTSHYLNSGKPQFVVGNITSFDLAAREYLGFGYSGSITIEEA